MEDDFHFGNAMLDENYYFVGIDHDRSFWPLTYKFHLQQWNNKIIAYKPYKERSTMVRMNNDENNWFLLFNKKPNSVGTLNIEDYEFSFHIIQ